MYGSGGKRDRESTGTDGSDAIGESLSTGVTEVSGEKREPIGEELGGDSELFGAIFEQEGIILESSLLVSHGELSRPVEQIGESMMSGFDGEKREISYFRWFIPLFK